MIERKYYPLKPETEAGFKEPVSWLGGRDLLASLKGMIMYSLYGDNIDPRSWMSPNIYPSDQELKGDALTGDTTVDEFWEKKVAGQRDWKSAVFKKWDEELKKHTALTDDPHPAGEFKEFWFDYIADSGDGQQAVYGVACLCLSDLWLSENSVQGGTEDLGNQGQKNAPERKVSFAPDDTGEYEFLPRGSFLFLGGDTAYHVADYATLLERFQTPFRWAFKSAREFLLGKYAGDSLMERYFYDLESKEPENLKPIYEDDKIGGKVTKDWDGTLTKRFENKAFLDTEPLRPIFGVPGNHDYYDDIDGFNRQFRRPPFRNVAENRLYKSEDVALSLAIPTFERKQEASYVALRLPFGWWMLGIDSENKKLDFRQKQFFKDIVEQNRPKKLIIATSEPTTVFGRKCREDDKTASYLKEITAPLGLEQPFLRNGEFVPLITKPETDTKEHCRLDLSGDVHHYARYWGPQQDGRGEFNEFASENYASVVAGGGGAFFDPTETLLGSAEVTYRNANEVTSAKVPGEIPPRVTYPSADCSRKAVAEKIFDLWNIKKGGYVQVIGAATAVIIYYYLTTARHFQETLQTVELERLGGVSADVNSWFFGLGALCLIPCTFLLYISGSRLHALVARLNTEINNQDLRSKNSKDLGRITQLRKPLLLCGAAVICYLVYFLLDFWLTQNKPAGYLNGFLNSVLLISHFIIPALLVRIGIEYSNWLPVSFKIMRQLGKQPDGWMDFIFRSPLNRQIRIERLNKYLGSRIWEVLKKQTVEYVPQMFLNLSALCVLFIGVYPYGSRTYYETVLDMVFIAITAGGFYLLVIRLAWSTGATYQNKSRNKLPFLLLGAWHAALQLATPFMILYFGDWFTLIVIFAMTVIANGASGFRALLYFLFPNIKKEKSGLKSILWALATWRLGARLMIQGRGALLTGWGTYVLALPIILWIPHRFGVEIGILPSWATLPAWVMLLLAGCLGYRFSRVWFSWYLAVAAALNGHNNEVGGAARIEGFKHILRIRVTKNELTVYVIGFYDAKKDLEELRPVLVDKFTLICKA